VRAGGRYRYGRHFRLLLRYRRNRHADAAVRRRIRPATVSLLPETHIAMVPVSRIVATMEDAFALLRAERGELPRAVNFISGPSRTGDIEQTIVLGAHGPCRVHLILTEIYHEHHQFAVRGEYIQLDQLLKATGLCESGGAAHAAIAEGRVRSMVRSIPGNGQKSDPARSSALPVRNGRSWLPNKARQSRILSKTVAAISAAGTSSGRVAATEIKQPFVLGNRLFLDRRDAPLGPPTPILPAVWRSVVLVAPVAR
jgi:hypothetical protein